MKTGIGINGFGRIGRLTLRATIERNKNDTKALKLNNDVDFKINTKSKTQNKNHQRKPGRLSHKVTKNERKVSRGGVINNYYTVVINIDFDIEFIILLGVVASIVSLILYIILR